MEKFEDRFLIFTLIILINIFNIIDTVATIFLFEEKLIIEINPIMAYFLQIGIGAFVAYKVIIVVFCSIILYNKRKYILTKLGVIIIFSVYFAVISWSLFHILYIYYLI